MSNSQVAFCAGLRCVFCSKRVCNHAGGPNFDAISVAIAAHWIADVGTSGGASPAGVTWWEIIALL